MYISLLSLSIIGGFIIYFVWQANKKSKTDWHLINLLCAVAYIVKYIPPNTKFYKQIEGQEYRFAFLLQYLQDLQNLKVDELNRKWVEIYDFFYPRTSPYLNTAPIQYTKYGRVTPGTILQIAEMYKSNSNVIGNSTWEDSMHYSVEAGKEDLNKGDYYHPKNVEELIKVIETYDQKHTGHVLMEKR